MKHPSNPLFEVALLFLKLGTIAFGGPAAHIAMMRDEVVIRRRWLTEQHFLDMLGATNIIPGPNSTEMAIHIGLYRAGWRGVIAGGVCFILPAMLIVLGLAWAYVRYGTTPQAEWLLYGIKPVVIAVILQALWGLLKTAIKSPLLAVLGVAVLALYLLGFNEIALLFGAGTIVMAVRNAYRNWQVAGMVIPLFTPLGALQLSADGVSFSLLTLFLTFLKIGAVIYGSGYVLLAFLRNDFVNRLGWLTDQQLLDAIAIGQVTPGPVFTSATFIGYVLGGLPGGVIATIAIFLPGFLFVVVIHLWIPKIRRSPWAGAFLDGVNVAALGLMAGVVWQLGREAIVDPLTVLLLLVAALLLVRFKINSLWLILAGAIIGLGRSALA